MVRKSFIKSCPKGLKIKQLIEHEIKKQIDVYNSNENRIISDYEKEQETFKEYNGRQILELLQNADDEKSDEVLIKLDTKKQTLKISNRGNNCNPFSIGGIQSLMLLNFSPKKRDENRKSYIGNKGLGFRSIINWSEQITIYTNDLKIDFSYNIAKEVYKEKTNNNISKISFLSLPKIKENPFNNWTTTIIIKYKNKFLNDMKQQLNNIKDEILLFVNHINKLIIDIDGKKISIERIKDNNQVYLNDKLWTIFEYKEDTLLPKEDENEELEHFDLKIAVKENFDNQDRYLLYSFFPTEVNIDFPFIIHGTFELDSSRNNITNSKKNGYILEKLVDFIANTAKELTKNKVNYTALEFLTHKRSNERLKKLEFYGKIDAEIDRLDIFPCLDNTYRIKDEILFIDDDFSEFIEKNNFEDIFPNMLISSQNSFINLKNYNIKNEINLSSIDEISNKIKDINIRIEFIYLIDKYFNNQNYAFEILIDEKNKIIKRDEEVYTPITKDYNFNIPSFVNIKFINTILYDKLLDKFEIISNEKSRDLQRKLKKITNIQSYEPAQVLQKIVTTTNKILEIDGNKAEIVKEMVLSLFENYKFLGKTRIPENIKIQLLDKNKELQSAKELFLSKSYPFGKLTEFLFGDIFDNSQFLIDKDFFDFKDDNIDEIERFFIWLGVNKYSKVEKIFYSSTDNYKDFLFEKYIKKPNNYSKLSYEVNKLFYIDKLKNLDIDKFILWILNDIVIQNELIKEYKVKYIKKGGHIEYSLISEAPSYILYQLYQTNIFKDYLVTNEKLSKLINRFTINFGSKTFKQYNIRKSDIESLILKIGAVEKLEEMSISRIREILKELEIKTPDGRQTQTIYKAVRNHHENLHDKSIKLCAKKDNKLEYCNQDEIYYASSVKLPKKILLNIPIINIPPRLGNVIKFFDIRDTKEIKIVINEHKENQNLNKEFQDFLLQIESFILVNRFDDLKDDKTKKIELSKLKNSKIILCNRVTYQIDEQNYELDYNDYIKDNKKYYIKVEDKRFDEIRDTSDFENTFSDIIGSIFNIVDVEKYERLISDNINKTEDIIKRKFGYEALQEAREYLNIADDFFIFWSTIYKLKNKYFNTKYKNQDIENIKQELNITINLNKLDYKNITSDDSCEVIQQLFKELNINIEDFNQEALYVKIDFTKFHQKNLENHFHNNYDIFEKILYQWCLDNDKQSKFIDLKGKYENADKIIQNILFMNYQNIIEKFIEENFDFTLQSEGSKLDFSKIYDNNVSEFEIEEFNNFQKSLLYFENGDKELKKVLQEENSNIKQENKISTNIDKTVPININITSIKSQNPPDNNNHKSSYGTHKPSNEKKQKQQGTKAEQCVFNYLLNEYGKANVKWFAKESDSGHYDMRYKKDDKWICVEVKTFSNGVFYLSKAEKKFAEETQDAYEIFLVEISLNQKCEEAKIYILNYDEFKKLKLIPNKYEVYYSVKENKLLKPKSV